MHVLNGKILHQHSFITVFFCTHQMRYILLKMLCYLWWLVYI